jgi:hypothetical protein
LHFKGIASRVDLEDIVVRTASHPWPLPRELLLPSCINPDKPTNIVTLHHHKDALV